MEGSEISRCKDDKVFLIPESTDLLSHRREVINEKTSEQ
jgi:hypothetical protein